MTRTYSNLRATSLTPEQHERTCGYWYTVTSGAMAHTAFATRAGLDRWLRERNLTLANDLPAQGEFGTTAIVGSYCERAYLDIDDDYRERHYPDGYDDDEAAFYALQPVDATPVLSNGDYTLGLLTEDAEGVRTVHYLNPNVKTRRVFDYKRTRQEMN